MDDEVLNVLKKAVETVAKSAATDLYDAAASRFVTWLAQRGKRTEVRARLDEGIERIRQAPEHADDETERLVADLQPLVRLDQATLDEFTASTTKPDSTAEPDIFASAQGSHESAGVLHEALNALRKHNISQQPEAG